MSTQVVKGGLRAARLARGWSVDHLVKLLLDAASRDGKGGTWDYWRIAWNVQRWESDNGTPGERYVCLLCEVFGMEPAELGLRWNLRAYKLRQAEASPTKALADASGGWNAVPLGAVVQAARAGNQGAADALAFAEMVALYGSPRGTA